MSVSLSHSTYTNLFGVLGNVADEFTRGLAKDPRVGEFGSNLVKGAAAVALAGTYTPAVLECAHTLRCWLEAAIEGDKDKEIRGDIKKALDRARDPVRRFVDGHSFPCGVIVTILALAVIALLVPRIISALGFGPEGPVADSWAARWQPELGDVEAGSMFSLFQSLCMRI